ncbi:hypothetical protein ABZ318_35735 [Streptomyces sp. NPDC006197]|uniref:hypothetical protein n=1 Tax=Streptomyces sp. NPDC006197 TaxID=3156685 RepID=UPI0033B0CCB7
MNGVGRLCTETLVMVHPIPDLTPELLERITDAVRLRAALYAAPAVPPPVRGRRARQYPGGRLNPPQTVRPRRYRRR